MVQIILVAADTKEVDVKYLVVEIIITLLLFDQLLKH